MEMEIVVLTIIINYNFSFNFPRDYYLNQNQLDFFHRITFYRGGVCLISYVIYLL